MLRLIAPKKKIDQVLDVQKEGQCGQRLRRRSQGDAAEHDFCTPLEKQEKIEVHASITNCLRTHPVAEDVEGVLRSILLRMPLRKLIQFRNVNRVWRSLLTSASFLQEWEREHRRWVVMRRGSELLAYDSAAKSWTDLGAMLSQIDVAHKSDLLEPNWKNAIGTETPYIATSMDSSGLICLVVRKEFNAGVVSSSTCEKLDQSFYSISTSSIRNGHCQKYLLTICFMLVLNPLTGFNELIPLPKSMVRLSDINTYCATPQVEFFFAQTRSEEEDAINGTYPQHYRIFFLERRENSDTDRDELMIYSSRDRSWKFADNLIRHGRRRGPIAFKDFDVIFPERTLSIQFRDLIAYSSKSNSWITLNYNSIPASRSNAIGRIHIEPRLVQDYIFRHGGRLFQAVVEISQERGGEYVLRGFCVQELQVHGHYCMCVKIRRTPEHFSQVLHSPEKRIKDTIILSIVKANFLYAGGLLYMTVVLHCLAQHASCGSGIFKWYSNTLVYDMDADSWHLAPPPPPPRHQSVATKPLELRPLCAMRPNMSVR